MEKKMQIVQSLFRSLCCFAVVPKVSQGEGLFSRWYCYNLAGFLYRKMIMSQSFQTCRLYVRNMQLMCCICIYKSCLHTKSNEKMLPLQGWAGQLNTVLTFGILNTTAASFKLLHVYSYMFTVCSSLNKNKQNTDFLKSFLRLGQKEIYMPIANCHANYYIIYLDR